MDRDGTAPVTVELTGSTLRATDVAGNEMRLDVTGWDRVSDRHPFDEPIDAAVAGRVSELRYDLRNFVGLRRLDDDLVFEDETAPAADRGLTRSIGEAEFVIDGEAEHRLTLPEGSYLCRLEMPMFGRLRFDGEATIANHPRRGLSISFPHPTAVTFGFTSQVDYPRHELTAEPTVEGIATALSHLSATIGTTDADRVHRNYRNHPPAIALGEETTIPEAVRERTPETGIELVVPDDLAALFPAAPLAYYLGATVEPTDVSTPLLRAPEAGVDFEFPGDARFDDVAATLLRRTFFLDFLTSLSESETATVREAKLLADAGIDVDGAADAPIADRLARYLAAPAEPIDEILPPWPTRIAVEPAPDYVPAIPHLLSDMSAIDLPSNVGVSGTARSSSRAAGDGASDREDGPHVLAERRLLRGVLGDVDDESADFVARPAAYEHRLADRERRRTERSVTVVFVGDAVADRAAVVDRYARRDEHVSPVVDRLDDPTRDELAAAIADGADFLHYVGDCDGAGLACRDGTLSPSELAANDVRLFQLDAPTSRSVAERLVETGSIAAVAADGTPAAPSPLIGELVLYGQSIASAAACAELEQPAVDRVVVGDGTHRFVSKWRPAIVQTLETTESGRVSATAVPFPVDPVGAHWLEEWAEERRLMSAPLDYEVCTDDLNRYLPSLSAPVYYDGEFYWMDDHRQLAYPLA